MKRSRRQSYIAPTPALVKRLQKIADKFGPYPPAKPDLSAVTGGPEKTIELIA